MSTKISIVQTLSNWGFHQNVIVLLLLSFQLSCIFSESNVAVIHEAQTIDNTQSILIVGTIGGTIHGLNVKTGREEWSLRTGKKMFSSSSTPLVGSDPLFIPSIDDSSIYIMKSGNTKGGQSVHKLPISVDELVTRSPFHSQDTLFVGKKETHIYGVDAVNGRVTRSFSTEMNSAVCKSDEEEEVFSKNTLPLVWIMMESYTIHAFDPSTGKERWNISTGGYSTSHSFSFLNPEKDENKEKEVDDAPYMVFNSFDGGLYCASSEMPHKAIWRYDPPSRVISAYLPSFGNILKKQPTTTSTESEVYIGMLEGALFAMEKQRPTSMDALLPTSPSNDPNGQLITVPTEYPLATVDCTNPSFFSPSCLVGFHPIVSIEPLPPALISSGTNDSQLIKESLEHSPSSSGSYSTMVMLVIFTIVVGAATMLYFIRRRAVPVEGSSTEVAQSKNKSRTKKKKKSATKAEPSGDANVVQVGKLHVHRQQILGYGQSGTIVFEGMLHGRQVAVKRMLSAFYNVATHEIKLLLESDHPNVIRYYGLEEDDQFVYLALTYCVSTLHDAVEKEIGSEVVCSRETLLQTAKGCAHLHDLNIVHQDIKPQNVLVDPKNGIRITDMGCSKKLEVDQSSFSGNGHSGSCGWQAPEILLSRQLAMDSKAGVENSDKLRITKKVDIFSLGCLFYYVLTKKHPFGNVFERENNILKGQHDILHLKATNPEAYDLIFQMIQFQPENRPTIHQILLHPYFWDEHKKLLFLKDASDRLEVEKPSAAIVTDIETHSGEILNGDWKTILDVEVTDSLGKFRKYDGFSVRCLLRVIRNKSHHYYDLPVDVQNLLGSLPVGFLQYFLSKFPLLFMATFHVIKKHCNAEEPFQKYFQKL